MLHSKVSSNENRNRRRKKTEWGNQGWREAGCIKPERHEARKKRPTEREREVKTLCTPMGDTCLCTHGWVIDLCSYSLPSTQNKKELLWFGPNFRLRNGFAPTHHNKAQILSVCLCEWVGGRFIHQTEQTIDTHTHSVGNTWASSICTSLIFFFKYWKLDSKQDCTLFVWEKSVFLSLHDCIYFIFLTVICIKVD